MKGMVHAILTSIREGNSFSDALKKHPQIFPPLYVNMVRAGETEASSNGARKAA